LQEQQAYDPRNYEPPVPGPKDKSGNQMFMFFFKPGNYYFGVVYKPGQAGEIFGKCRVSPALNVQIPYYKNDDVTKGDLVKIHWINLQAKDKEAQARIGKRFQTALMAFPNGGERLKSVIEFIITQGDKDGSLIKDKRTDYDWFPNQPGNTWPKGDPQPPIPPKPK